MELRDRRWRMFFNIWNAICLLVLLTRLVIAICTGWINDDISLLDQLIFKLNFLLWKVLVVLQAFILMITSYKHSRSYRHTCDQAVKYLESIGVEVNWRRGRRVQIILLSIESVLILGLNCTSMSTYNTVEPFYGASLSERTKPEVFSALHVFGWPTLIQFSVYYIAFTAHFASVACHAITLIDSFNTKLAAEAKDSVSKLLTGVIKYKRGHSMMCDVVEKAERMFSHSIGITMLFCAAFQFMIIYILTKRVNSTIETATQILWFIGSISNVIAIVFIGHQVQAKVSSISINGSHSKLPLSYIDLSLQLMLPIETLLKLDDPNEEINVSTVHKVRYYTCASFVMFSCFYIPTTLVALCKHWYCQDSLTINFV